MQDNEKQIEDLSSWLGMIAEQIPIGDNKSIKGLE